MAEIKEFEAPDFLTAETAESIQERMMENLPDGIDTMPGGFPYDFTMPTAIEKATLLQFNYENILMLAFPDWAWGPWLDLHARTAGVARHQTTAASGKVTITGTTGTVIPSGTGVCTEATNDSPSIVFTTDEMVIIPDTGSVDVTVTAQETGSGSNVNAKTVTFFTGNIKGAETVINSESLTGGTDVETDDSLRQRILEAYAEIGRSFIANDSDYIRWAKSIDGVGDCIVIPTWNGPGTVKLVLVDANGVPASEKLCEAVYDYIVSPDDRTKRLLPTGSAELTVEPATTKTITFTCTGLKYDSTTSVDQIKTDFKVLAAQEYSEAKTTGMLYYNQLRGHVTEVSGVIDFDTFLMNGGTENIELAADEYAATGDLNFS